MGSLARGPKPLSADRRLVRGYHSCARNTRPKDCFAETELRHNVAMFISLIHVPHRRQSIFIPCEGSGTNATVLLVYGSAENQQSVRQETFRTSSNAIRQ